MRCSPRFRRTLRALMLVAALLVPACAEPEPPDAALPASSEAPPDDLTGRWSAADGPGTLILRPDGTFTLHHDLGGAPYEGTYTALDDGRLRLDVPDFAPIFMEREGEALSFRVPGGNLARYERS